MKGFKIRIVVLLGLLALGAVAQTNEGHPSVNLNRYGVQFKGDEMPSRVETITYDWEKYRVSIIFHRQSRDAAWFMTIADSWSVSDQLVKEERVWDTSESRCSTEDLLKMIDQGLSLFGAEKPGAKIRAIRLEMQVPKELWAEVLGGLGRRLALLDGVKEKSRADVPDEVGNELQSAWNRSNIDGKLKIIFQKHSLIVREPGPSTVTFKDSLTGHKWVDISKLADVGILIPGVIEFGVVE